MPYRHFRCTSCGGIVRVDASRLASGPRCGRCKASVDATGAAVDLPDAAVQALIDGSPVPVLVDFHAAWCGPCRTVGPILDALGRRHAGRLIVVKVDTDREQALARRLGVQGIPAVFLFSGGELVDRAVGAHPPAHWEAMVAKHLPD